MAKIVYKDQDNVKVIRGTILDRDEFLIRIQTEDGSVYSIGKSVITSIVEDTEDE